MDNFFEYLDYRSLLKELIEQRKSKESWYSYRWLSKRIGITSSGFLSLVMTGKRNISPDVALKLSQALKLTKSESGYFLSLVRYNQAVNADEKERFFEELLRLRPADAKSLRTDQQEFYNHWYYSAIRELVSIAPVCDNYKQIAERLLPKISTNEVRDALELLLRLGLIHKNTEGYYQRSDTLITAAGSVIEPSVIRKYQGETLDIAKNALYSMSKNERDISTVTLSTNSRGMEMIKKRIEQCRSEVMAIAKQSMEPDRIIQLNIQLFPLIKPEDKSLCD